MKKAYFYYITNRYLHIQHFLIRFCVLNLYSCLKSIKQFYYEKRIVLLLFSFGRYNSWYGFEYCIPNETFYTLINDVINFMIISFAAGNARFVQLYIYYNIIYLLLYSLCRIPRGFLVQNYCRLEIPGTFFFFFNKELFNYKIYRVSLNNPYIYVFIILHIIRIFFSNVTLYT